MSFDERMARYAEKSVRAVEVRIGTVTGWQVQTRMVPLDDTWTSTHVMCDKETAEAEVERLRQHIVDALSSEEE